METSTGPKSTISARVSPDLKLFVEQQAKKSGQSVSVTAGLMLQTAAEALGWNGADSLYAKMLDAVSAKIEANLCHKLGLPDVKADRNEG